MADEVSSTVARFRKDRNAETLAQLSKLLDPTNSGSHFRNYMKLACAAGLPELLAVPLTALQGQTNDLELPCVRLLRHCIPFITPGSSASNWHADQVLEVGLMYQLSFHAAAVLKLQCLPPCSPRQSTGMDIDLPKLNSK